MRTIDINWLYSNFWIVKPIQVRCGLLKVDMDVQIG